MGRISRAVTLAAALLSFGALLSPAGAADEASTTTATSTTSGPVSTTTAAGGLPQLDCSEADQRHELTAGVRLDPTCVWSEGFDITASDVVLDCQGALIRNDGGGRGIDVSSPVDIPMSGVVVRGCVVDGFLNSLRVTRPGFRDLTEGVEYENGLTGVVIENNEFRNSRGVGVFIDGYVSDAVIRDNIVRGAGSTGIYLETGSRRSRVENNMILGNGGRENGPLGQVDTFGGLRFRWWGIGREGLAIDGSYENVVTGNWFWGNRHGGILLYTNCGEFPDSGRWFDRRWPSDRNLIEDNTFTGGLNGVWVGQRMAENTLPMECTKPAYVEGPLLRVTRDDAADNEVRDNVFTNVTYPVRVEDDGTTVADNTITSADPNHHGIIVGTEYRTDVLDEPVADTTITGNRIDIAGNASPIRWIHGFDGLTVDANTANGEPVGICEGVQPPRLALIWVIAAAFEPIGSPETPAPADLSHPVLGPLEPCERPAEPAVVPGFDEVIEGTDDTIVIPVQLSHASDQTVSVHWYTPEGLADMLATVGTDIVYGEGDVEFEPGQTEGQIVLELIDDAVAEPFEYAAVLVREPVNARIGGWWGIGLGLVTDDD
ncbi:MAG: right-handed parallel beta-helix repeat-containing protein [Acidimicrobiales bacterium]